MISVKLWENYSSWLKKKSSFFYFVHLSTSKHSFHLNSLSNILRLKSRKSPTSKIQVARPGIELRTPCSASHELLHSTTTAPFSTVTLDKRYVHDTMKHTMRQKEKERDLTQWVLWRKPLNSTTNLQHKNTTKNFDYTTIADRLRTVSWSNNIHPTGVV